MSTWYCDGCKNVIHSSSHHFFEPCGSLSVFPPPAEPNQCPPTPEPAESEGPCEDCGHGKHAHSDHRCYSAGSVTQEECLCSQYHPPTPSPSSLEDRAIRWLETKAPLIQHRAAVASAMRQFAQSEIARQTPAIIERYKREIGFNAIVFNGECAERLLREQGIYVGDGGEVVNTKVERLEKAIRSVLSHFESHQVYDKGSEAILRSALTPQENKDGD